jgi:hypothetical protein
MKLLPPFLGGLVSVGLLACSGPGNDGHHEPPMELREQIPWINGVPPLLANDGTVIMSDLPVYPDIASGVPDPGSNADGRSIARGCAAAAHLEFAEAWLETFEGEPLAVGQAWASYDDASANSFRTPVFFNWYQALLPRPSGFGLPADAISDGPSCNGEENAHALHFKGGRFNRFGAGIDHALGLAEYLAQDLARLQMPDAPTPDGCPRNPDGSRPDLCAPEIEDGAEVDSAGLPVRDYAQPHVFWDLSRYDGIAFWARRGPEGQSTMLVKVQDKFTSDDLSRENQTYCKRLRPCDSRCLNRAPCALVGAGNSQRYRCFDGDPAEYRGTPLDDGLEDLLFPPCGDNACTAQVTYPDPDFETASCQPFTFPSNHESGEFCVNPGEEPAPPEERCGDGPGRTVLLTTDWQFYTIPFGELRQLNFAKTEPYLDLKSIAMLSFIFTVGWVDVYLDNVTFYRNKN